MKSGFTLIELVVAITISSIIGILLFNVLNQSSRLLTRVDSIVTSDISIVTFYDRFEKDIMGAFIPVIGDLNRAKKVLEQHESEARSHEIKKQEAKEGESESKPLSPVTLKKIQVQKPFIYEKKDENLALFSFITCNPLQVYKQIKPRIARVVYTLKSVPGEPKTYQLLRKESNQLGFDVDKEARNFVLLRNIRSLKLKFLAVEPKKNKKQLEKAEQDKKKRSSKKELNKTQADTSADKKAEKEKKTEPLKTYTIWPPKKEKEGRELGDLPQFVTVVLEYDDPFEKVTKTHTFTFPIFNYRAPGEDVLNVPLMLQERLKKDEDEENAGTSGGLVQATGRRSGSQTARGNGKGVENNETAA